MGRCFYCAPRAGQLGREIVSKEQALLFHQLPRNPDTLPRFSSFPELDWAVPTPPPSTPLEEFRKNSVHALWTAVAG